jgi:hypothetical protein
MVSMGLDKQEVQGALAVHEWTKHRLRAFLKDPLLKELKNYPV